MIAKVSILMPAYNECSYIEAAVGSALEQNYNNLQVIVVDDFSIDQTYELANSRYAANNRVRVYRNPVKGKVNAFNYAFNKCDGDIIILCAADDILTRDSVRSRVEELDKISIDFPACVYGRLKTFSKDKKYDGITIPKREKGRNNSGGVIAINRRLAEMIFPIPDSLASEDGWLGLVCQHFSRYIVYIPSIVLNYRIHEGNSINRYASFEEVSARLAKRRQADRLFLAHFVDELNDRDKLHLQALVNLEQYRLEKNYFGLLSQRYVGFRDKLRSLSYSNKIIYMLRMRMFKYFSGL